MSDDRPIRISDVHMTKKFRASFVSSFSEEISSLTICSPYFNKLPAPFENVIEFCRFVQTRNDATIQIITDPLAKDQIRFLLMTRARFPFRMWKYLYARNRTCMQSSITLNT